MVKQAQTGFFADNGTICNSIGYFDNWIFIYQCQSTVANVGQSLTLHKWINALFFYTVNTFKKVFMPKTHCVYPDTGKVNLRSAFTLNIDYKGFDKIDSTNNTLK